MIVHFVNNVLHGARPFGQHLVKLLPGESTWQVINSELKKKLELSRQYHYQYIN